MNVSKLILVVLICLASGFKQVFAQQKHLQDCTIDSTAWVFQFCEQMPQFPGGQDSMLRFIQRNLEMPGGDIDFAGKTILQFIVKENGELCNIKTVGAKHFGFEFEESAINVIKKMPNWKPGKQNGKAIRVEYVLPIRFGGN